jgi:DNA-binding NarL/FixJ family response regulator
MVSDFYQGSVMPHIDGSNRLVSGPDLRVLIVEDHPLMRRAMAGVIDDQPRLQVCGEADTVDEALQLLKTSRPQVVIVDLGLSGGHGIELIGRIRSHSQHIKVLVVSAQDERLYAERCLRAGASGYLHKREAADRLIDALHRVVEGEVYLSEAMANQLLSLMVRRNGTAPDADPITTLSNRELGVFEMIGQGLATKEIAAQLDLSTKTIETHRENIKRKLGLPKTNDLMRRAVEWVLENR